MVNPYVLRYDYAMPFTHIRPDSNVTIKNEGTNLTTNVVSIDFVGAGVNATGTTDVTATISGSSGTRTENDFTASTNGSTTAFTLTGTPISGTLVVFLDGVFMLSGSGNDYTQSGTTLTMNTAPLANSKLIARYET